MIALLVPSRGRPQMLYDMWGSAISTAADRQHVRLYVALDDDDPTRDETIERLRPEPIVLNIGPRQILSLYWNDLWKLAKEDDATIFWHGNDDVLFRTRGWDTAIRHAFETWPDRIGCVHGNDLIHNGNMATLGYYSREWTETLGYMVPPYFASDWNDTWLSWCADQIGRRCHLPDVTTEHMHYIMGKMARDQTTIDRLTVHAQANVDQIYIDKTPEREADVLKLRKAIWAYEAAHRIKTE